MPSPLIVAGEAYQTHAEFFRAVAARSGLSVHAMAAWRRRGLSPEAILARAGRVRQQVMRLPGQPALTPARLPPLTAADHRGCRWISGDPRQLHSGMFCNAAVAVPGESWCQEHRARVFYRPSPATEPLIQAIVDGLTVVDHLAVAIGVALNDAVTAAETMGAVLSQQAKMTAAAFARERNKLRETYGDGKRAAGAHYEQRLARLYSRSAWTQDELAKKEGISRSQVSVLLLFGRFIDFAAACNARLPPLTRFRSCWSRTAKDVDETDRFRDVAQLLEQDAAAPRPPRYSKRMGHQIINQFGDGEWHGVEEIAAAVGGPVVDVDYVLQRMYTTGAYGIHGERRRVGASWEYRLRREEKDEPVIAVGEVTAKLGPLAEALAAEGRKSPVVAHLGAELRAVLDGWTGGAIMDRAAAA